MNENTRCSQEESESKSSIKLPKGNQTVDLIRLWFQSSNDFSMCFPLYKRLPNTLSHLIHYNQRGIISHIFQMRKLVSVKFSDLPKATNAVNNSVRSTPRSSEFRCQGKRSSRNSSREQNSNHCLASGNLVSYLTKMSRLDNHSNALILGIPGTLWLKVKANLTYFINQI